MDLCLIVLEVIYAFPFGFSFLSVLFCAFPLGSKACGNPIGDTTLGT